MRPEVDTYATAGHLSVELDADDTRMLLGEVPAAFHAGIQDILLIGFALAWAQFLDAGDAPIGIDVEGHGRHEELAADVDLSRTVGWFTTKYPVSLTVRGLSWAQVVAGEAALGAVIKDAKEQLRALPDGLTYGLLRYLNTEVDLEAPTRRSGSTIWDAWAPSGPVSRSDLWRLGQDGLSVAGAATAVPMPLAHTVELNAGAVDTETGPQLQADWTWATSALDHAQVTRLSRLWFDALTGICAHVRAGGGGLTPSDIAPARLGQQQIDELQRQYRIADILPLTPLQQGLLFHTSTAQASVDMYAVQLDFTVTGALDPRPPARCGAHGGHSPSPPGGPIPPASSTSRSRSSRPIPKWLGASRFRLPTATSTRRRDRPALRRRTRSGLRPGRPAGVSGRPDPRRGATAPICADQSPHRARRLVDADPAARNLRQLLRAAAAPGRVVSEIHHLAGRSGPRCRPRGVA